MDTEKQYSCIEKVCKVYSKSVDAEGEYQETLPAYLDDIYRVVKCTAHSYITSADISFNEVKVYGKTEIQITYYNENSELCYADFDEEFSKALTVDNLSDNAFVRAQICDRYTTFRVINQRRIDVHTMAVLNISVYDTLKYPMLCSCENSKFKTEQVSNADVISTYVDKIEFDEDVSLPAGTQAIGRIIGVSAFPVIDDVKVIKDKALIKANVAVSVLFTVDNDVADIGRVEYTFQLSKIIEKSSIDDGDIVIPDISLGAVYAKVKGAGEKQSQINVYGEVSINLTLIRENTTELITDGYVVGATSDSEYTEYSSASNGKYINEQKSVSVPLEFNSEIIEIKDLSVSLKTPVYKNGNIGVTVEALAVTENDSGLATLGTTTDIEIPTESYDEAIVSISIAGYDFTLAGGGRVDLRLTLDITAYLYNNESVRLLSDMNIGASVDNSHTLTVYFADENESVWSIAKQFSSDESDIISENQLSGDTLKEARVLIIPRA